MKINNIDRKITALLLLGFLAINVLVTIPETEKSEKLTSLDLNSAYGMPSSILGLLQLTNFLYLLGIIYSLLNLDDRFKISQKDEVNIDKRNSP